MNFMQLSLLTCVSAAALMVSVAQAAPSDQATLNGREVAEKFDYVLRKSHSSMIVKFKLSSCKYRIKKAKVRCTEKPRVSVFENILKYFGDDIRSAAITLEPARDRGIGSLTYEYYDVNKDNASWIYLSALGKVKRIISSQDSDDSGSFFGSEFAIEDLDWRKLNDYSYKVLGEEVLSVPGKKGIEERPVYILEWLPTDKRKKKSRYGRTVSWIDAERFILLKEDYYDHNLQLIKKRTLKNVELIDNNWMARDITMNNIATKRVTTMKRLSIAFNVEIDDEFLTQRTLTDFAFRERYLRDFRTYWD